MSRRIEPSALSRVVTDAVRDHLEAVVARYLPHPERRTTPLALVVALVNAVAAQVGALTLDDRWQAAAPVPPREVGMELADARARVDAIVTAETRRALAMLLELEARYEYDAVPVDVDEARVRAEVDAIVAARAESVRREHAELAAAAEARRAAKHAEKRAAEQAKAQREQAKRDKRKGERAARGDARARARVASGHVPPHVRGAYAELGLDLGAGRDLVEARFRARIHEVHPDKHATAGTAALLDAHKRTLAVKAARATLLKWLDSA